MVSKKIETLYSGKDRAYIAKVSSIISLITKMISFLLSFETRRLFLSTLGAEYLGLNQTLSQVLNALAVSELGIQAVIIYLLYKPVARDDIKEIEEIVSVYRNLYRIIGGFILGGSIIISPFLGALITNVGISNKTILVSWGIMALTSASTYFLSYNSAIIYAALKQYIYMLGDGIIRCVFGLINLWALFYFKNYYIYLLIASFSTIISGIMLYIMRKKMYPWLTYIKPSRETFFRVARSVKDLIWGRICGYIFNSTDSIIISAFISTPIVAFLGNYSTIFWSVYLVFTSIIEPVQALVGNYLVDAESKNTLVFLKRYDYIVFWGGTALFVPTAVLASDFVSLFYGDEYVISWVIVALLLADFFVITMQTPVGMLLDAGGKFKEQKVMHVVSAMINIVFSLIGVKAIGLAGVLLGTVVGRIFLWICRAHLSYSTIIIGESEKRYWLSQLKKIVIFLCIIALIMGGIYVMNTNASLIIFAIKGVMCEVVIFAINIILYRKKDEYIYAKGLIWHKIH